MNDVDFGLLVVAVPLAGYGLFLGGRAYERKIAKQAFRQLAHQAMMSTTAMMNVMVGMVKKRLPDLTDKELMREVIDGCAAVGIQAVAVDTNTKEVMKGPEVSDDNKAE